MRDGFDRRSRRASQLKWQSHGRERSDAAPAELTAPAESVHQHQIGVGAAAPPPLVSCTGSRPASGIFQICNDPDRLDVTYSARPSRDPEGSALTADGHTMFFSSGTDNPFAPGAINHLYVSERQNDPASWGPRNYLDTLNCPTCFGGLPTIRAGGKEICWMGNRGDSVGDMDVYCAIRQ